MSEQLDKEYEEYLSERLDLIFEETPPKPRFPDTNTKKAIDVLGKDSELFSEYEIDNFVDGIARAKKNDRIYLMDTNGKLISDEWYDNFYGFYGKYARVRKYIKGDLKYNYVDAKGKLINEKKWFAKAEDFDHGYAVVSIKDEWHILKENGSLIELSRPHYHILYMYPYTPYRDYRIPHSLFLGTIYNSELRTRYNIFDAYGNIIFKKDFTSYSDNGFDFGVTEINDNFIYLISPYHERALVCKTEILNGYDVTRIHNKYQCIKGNQKFVLKYKPLVIYDSGYALCFSSDEVLLLYNRNNNKYLVLGNIRDYEFKDDFLFDKQKKEVHFIYGGQIYNITSYYNKKLKDGNYRVKQGIEIKSKNDIFVEKENKIKEETRKAREEKELADLEKSQVEDARRIRNLKDVKDLQEKKNLILLNEAYRSVIRGIEKLEEYEQETGIYKQINVNNLFIEVDDHKEIRPLYLEMGLRHINLSNETFEDVKVSCLDFRGCNISLNPQKVYNKDLSNCNFTGVFFPVSTNFTGVNVKGAKFTTNNNPIVFEINYENFANSIYDENTTLNGKSFVEIYGPCKNNKEHNR